MIALLSCSMNSLASDVDTIPSTGGFKQNSLTHDSVLIAYSDLRKVNSKLIELEYEKEINRKYKEIVSNDSIAISDLRNTIIRINTDNTRNIRNVKRQRNIASGIGVTAIILLIISLL